MQRVLRYLLSEVVVQDRSLQVRYASDTWQEIPFEAIEHISCSRVLGQAITLIKRKGEAPLSLRFDGSELLPKVTGKLQAMAAQALATAREAIPRGYPTHQALDEAWEHCIHDIIDDLDILRTPFASQLVTGTSEIQELEDLLATFHGGNDKRKAHIEAHVARELEQFAEYFNTVEKQPLTEEQRLACVVSDDRQLLIAAAGSGKSSTIVAKIGYILKKGWVKPEEIVALAFNKTARNELHERAMERLAHYQGHERLQMKTFHGFGYELIGKLRGKKPRISDLVTEDQRRFRLLRSFVQEGIAEQRRIELGFRMLQKAVLGQDRPPVKVILPVEDEAGMRSLKGDLVTSTAELRIANFLFSMGIPYVYGGEYSREIVDVTHGEFKPTFYYPTLEIYHEHFALNASGRATNGTHGYHERTKWRRQVHEVTGSRYFVTSDADFDDNSVYDQILIQLERFGFNFEKDIKFEKSAREAEVVDPVIATLDKYLSNRKLSIISDEEIRQRAASGCAWILDVLPLTEYVMDRYQTLLSSRGEIDFTDMINEATAALRETGKDIGVRWLLLDEFQDISTGRADMVRAILDNCPGCRLFCVGDDWQAINGFAGSEVRIMNEFEKEFGKGTIQYLSQTFRSNQGIATTASSFITKNPAQFKKEVKAFDPRTDKVIEIHIMQDAGELAEILRSVCAALPPEEKKRSVFLLARYNHFLGLKETKPSDFEAIQLQAIETVQEELKGSTIKLMRNSFHGSKGLESEVAILLGLVSQQVNRRCFPSRMPEDAFLTLPLPVPEPFKDAEERRLMYVALTRAKSKVVIPTMLGGLSPFLEEILLEDQPAVEVLFRGTKANRCPACGKGHLLDAGNHQFGCTRSDCDLGIHLHRKVCPQCNDGIIVPLLGKFGFWAGCSRFPSCTHSDEAFTQPLRRVSVPSNLMTNHSAVQSERNAKVGADSSEESLLRIQSSHQNSLESTRS